LIGKVRVRIAATLLLALASGTGRAQGPDTTRVVSPIVTAEDSALEATTKALASELRCPVCQGLSIQDSPSELALDMRDVIKEQLRAGRSPEEVRQYFLDKYGEWILLEPRPQGFNLVVYLLPVAALLGGLAIVWRAVRRWTASATVEAGSPPPAVRPRE
jgi:cytochrome c-type biogenesis protein CcmH